MINKKTKSFGVVLLSILMIFSLVIFTACEPLDPADPPSNPPANIYTKENAITVLTNAITILKQKPMPATATVNVGTEGMTEYKGIDGWELNSVDFNRDDTGDMIPTGILMVFSLFKKLLEENLININEDYETYKYENDYSFMKIKFENNKMISYARMPYRYTTDEGVGKYLITFNDELQVQNVIIEIMADYSSTEGYDEWGYNVEYYANNARYYCYGSCMVDDIDSESELQKGLNQSMNAEYAARVKPTTEIVDIGQFIQEIES